MALKTCSVVLMALGLSGCDANMVVATGGAAVWALYPVAADMPADKILAPVEDEPLASMPIND